MLDLLKRNVVENFLNAEKITTTVTCFTNLFFIASVYFAEMSEFRPQIVSPGTMTDPYNVLQAYVLIFIFILYTCYLFFRFNMSFFDQLASVARRVDKDVKELKGVADQPFQRAQ